MAQSSITAYGTDTVAIYTTDDQGNTRATVTLKGVKYRDMSKAFTDQLMLFCQQFNL